MHELMGETQFGKTLSARFPSGGQVPPVQESSSRKLQVGDHCRNEQGGDGAACGLGLWLGQVFPSYECYPGNWS